MKPKFRKGITLVEVLVSVFIFSLIFLAIFSILAQGKMSWATADAQIELQQEIRRALITMNTELRQSRSAVIVGVPADGNPYPNVTFNVPEDTDGDGDVIDATGNMEWSNSITYSLAANQIIRTQAGATTILANRIINLQFSRQAATANIIEMDITAQRNTFFGRTLQANIGSSVRMRN